MAGYTQCSDDQTICAVLPPAQYTSTTARCGYVNMSGFNRLQFIVTVGVTGAAESVTAAVQQATDTTGAGVKALNSQASGNALTLTAPITASNKSAVINVNAQELDVANGFTSVSLLLTFVTSATAGTETVAGVVAVGQPEITPPAAFAGSQVIY